MRGERQEPRAIILAVDDARLRQRFRTVLAEHGHETETLPSAWDAIEVSGPARPLILETADDAASFTQVVYELHRKGWKHGSMLPVIGIFSADAGRRNPTLSCLVIDGQAAVAGMLPRGGRDMEQALLEFVKRIQASLDAPAPRG